MTIAQRHGAEMFSIRENDIDYSTFEGVAHVLGRDCGDDLTVGEFENLWIDWNAFTREPEKYKDSFVVDMVNQYLEEEAEDE